MVQIIQEKRVKIALSSTSIKLPLVSLGEEAGIEDADENNKEERSIEGVIIKAKEQEKDIGESAESGKRME